MAPHKHFHVPTLTKIRLVSLEPTTVNLLLHHSNTSYLGILRTCVHPPASRLHRHAESVAVEDLYVGVAAEPLVRRGDAAHRVLQQGLVELHAVVDAELSDEHGDEVR